MLETIFNLLGGGGPIILFIYSIYLLWVKRNLLFYYIIGFFTNSILNILLKGIIQEPRPSENAKLFNLAISNAKKNVFKNGIPFDVFGMPSGHAQSVLFSTCFIYIALKNQNVLVFYLLVSIITIFQRVYNNHHTFFQIIVGCIIGGLFALGVFHLAQQNLKGRIREKRDDFGPI